MSTSAGGRGLFGTQLCLDCVDQRGRKLACKEPAVSTLQDAGTDRDTGMLGRIE